jgi:hypothetical protein
VTDLIPSSHNPLLPERQHVREQCFPASGPLPLNGLHARHLLEASAPEHRDRGALETDLNDRITRLESPDESEQRQERQRLMLRRAFINDNLTFGDLEPFRVRAGYRWVREVSMLKSLVADDQMLSEALLGCPPSEDPWMVAGVGETPKLTGYVRMRADVVKMVNGKKGLPLLPPPPAPEWFGEDGKLLDDYDPKEDRLLMRWLDAFDRVTTYLGVPRGAVTNPDEGRWGLYGMLSPDTVRLCFPSVLQMLTWEEMLVSETWNHMVVGGQVDAERQLRATYGFSDVETHGLIRRAKTFGAIAYSQDEEGNRALMIARLDDLTRRCREGVPDIRAELAALKAQALVQGLTKGEQDDFEKEVRDVVLRATATRLPDRTPPRALPPG